MLLLGLDETLAEPPSVEVAKAAMTATLPHDEEGRRFPLTAPLATFDSFGIEIAAYMRFMTYTGRVFCLALLLNLSTILNNLDGGHSSDLLAAHSLNNADCLGNSHGVIEVLTSALFVWYTSARARPPIIVHDLP